MNDKTANALRTRMYSKNNYTNDVNKILKKFNIRWFVDIPDERIPELYSFIEKLGYVTSDLPGAMVITYEDVEKGLTKLQSLISEPVERYYYE